MPVTVGQILELLDGIAPFALAEEWDNVGLLCGSKDMEAERILCALDLTPKVIREAEERHAQMILTHHPILFHPRRNLRTDDPEGRLLYALARSGMAMAAMHTNYDNAHPGVNDALASKLDLKDVVAQDGGMCIGQTVKCTLRSFADHAEAVLGDKVRVYGDPDRMITKVAVLGGAGEDYAPFAIQGGADVYVTGEIAYHKALDAVENGLCVLEAGHAATENPAVSQLADALQNAADSVQYKICVLVSAQKPFF